MKFTSMKADIARNLKLAWPTMFALTASISVFAIVYFLAHLRMRQHDIVRREVLMAISDETDTADES